MTNNQSPNNLTAIEAVNLLRDALEKSLILDTLGYNKHYTEALRTDEKDECGMTHDFYAEESDRILKMIEDAIFKTANVAAPSHPVAEPQEPVSGAVDERDALSSAQPQPELTDERNLPIRDAALQEAANICSQLQLGEKNHDWECGTLDCEIAILAAVSQPQKQERQSIRDAALEEAKACVEESKKLMSISPKEEKETVHWALDCVIESIERLKSQPFKLDPRIVELERDAKRLDYLETQCEAYGFEGYHEGIRWMIDGPFGALREAIDAALSASQPKEEKAP